MTSLPVDTPAGRTSFKAVVSFDNIREHFIFDIITGDLMANYIAFEAACKQAALVNLQVEMFDDCFQLLLRRIGFNKQVSFRFNSLDQLGVTCQYQSILFEHHRQQFSVIQGAFEIGVISQHPQVASQFAEVVIAKKLHINKVGG